MSSPLAIQAKKPANIKELARDFVQRFYDWYVPRALKENAGPSSDLALKYRSYVFSPELFRALKKDSNSSKKADGEVVGLDFDPFLNSQDPGDRYEVGKVTHEGDSYRVEVYGVWSGKKSETPDVVPDLVLKNGRWLFINFYYPNLQRDLVSILKALAEDRRRPAK
ncbi:MAG: hypothetical protein ACRD4H_05690 [Candidatus Acidiferrales bacterium]